jgi:hypothetical protein
MYGKESRSGKFAHCKNPLCEVIPERHVKWISVISTKSCG